MNLMAYVDTETRRRELREKKILSKQNCPKV